MDSADNNGNEGRERKPAQRHTAPWLLAGTVLVLLAIIVAQQLFNFAAVLPPETGSDTLLLYALSSLNFAAFIVFSFILLRSLLRLRRERREQGIGREGGSRGGFRCWPYGRYGPYGRTTGAAEQHTENQEIMRAHHVIVLALIGCTPAAGQVRPGIDVLFSDSLHLVAGKRVVLLTNHTGVDRSGRRSGHCGLALGGPTCARRGRTRHARARTRCKAGRSTPRPPESSASPPARAAASPPPMR